MAEIIRIKVSDTPKIPDSRLKDFKVLGLDPVTNDNAHAEMEQLRGNTAFQEWQSKNPGKTYEDWIKLLQEPARQAADTADKKMTEFALAESSRVTAETARVTAETNRVTSEKARVTAETTRTTAESSRATAETTRVNAEKNRATAESSRVTAETNRVTSEKARVTAESKRQTDTTEALNKSAAATKKATDAADRSNALSDHRDEIRAGYWWRWNETTKAWYNTGQIAKGNVMFASFEINPATGELAMQTDEEYTGANFALDNGVLTVEI